MELGHLDGASAEAVDKPGLLGPELFTQAYHTVKIPYNMNYHGLAVTLRYLHLQDKGLLLNFVRRTL